MCSWGELQVFEESDQYTEREFHLRDRHALETSNSATLQHAEAVLSTTLVYLVTVY